LILTSQDTLVLENGLNINSSHIASQCISRFRFYFLSLPIILEEKGRDDSGWNFAQHNIVSQHSSSFFSGINIEQVWKCSNRWW